MITEITLWKIVKLKDIASQIQYGYTAKAKGTESGPRFLRITDIQDETVEWSTVPSCEIPTKDKEKYLLSEGDIVFARTGATVGKSYLIRSNVPEAVFASYLIRVRLQRDIDPRYINYFFRSPSYWRQISESSAGIGQPNVNGSKLADLQIPFAPPKDQKRIVAEIEKQFSRLDEAVASLKRIQANLKRYKAAVLKAAVEGKLTEQWRKDHPDVEPADQLLKRILAERRAKWETEELTKMKAKGIKPKDDSWKKKYKEPGGPDTANLPELPDGWVWVSLQQVFKTITDGDHQPPPQTETGIPFLVIGNVRTGKIDLSDTRFVSAEYYSAIGEERTPRINDILYTLVGSYGIAVLIEDERQFCIQRHIGILKPNDSTNIRFFKQVLNSNFVYRQATSIATGTAQLTVPLGGLRMVAVPLPPVSEQTATLDEIDRRLSVTEEFETTIETNLKRAERLRQTILQKAFSGGLV